MATVELRDIVTEADREAAIALRRGPGQDAFVASVEKSLAEAVLYPEACARYWAICDGDAVVGFAMISDGIPEETLAEDPTLLGPYLPVAPAHRRIATSGAATARAALDAIVDYVRGRPGARKLLVSAGQGEGSPQPFYERYGFVPTGQIHEGEVVLELDLAGR